MSRINRFFLAAGGCILTTALLAGCQPKILDFRNAQISNGKIYEGNSSTPFTGKITNFPGEKIFPVQNGFQKFAEAISNTVETRTGTVSKNIGAPMAVTLSFNLLCDSSTDDGLLNGEILCKEKGINSTAIDAKFKGGVLVGDLKHYATLSPGKRYRSTVTFNEGQPNGKQEVYSENGGRTVSIIYWSNGIFDGKEEHFDEQTGKTTLSANIKNGKYDGEFLRYSPEGKLIRKGTYDQGIPLLDESFDPQTGKMTGHAGYENGQLQGVVKQWDANGNLVLEKHFDKGVEVSSSSGAAPSISADACVDSWIAAFRKENGEETLVTHDQLGEWESWCKEGKRPV